MPNGDYEVSEESTAKQAFECCVSSYGGDDVQRDCLDHVVDMLNGKHISPNDTVSEGDLLMVLRPVHGG